MTEDLTYPCLYIEPTDANNQFLRNFVCENEQDGKYIFVRIYSVIDFFLGTKPLSWS